MKATIQILMFLQKHKNKINLNDSGTIYNKNNM